MAYLTRDAILSAPDLRHETVDCPEWGGEVEVYGLTAAELDRFQAEVISMKGRDQEVNLQNIRSKLAVMAIRDGDGKRIFTDSDLSALSGKSARPLSRIFETAQRLSGLTAGDVDTLAKN